MGDPESRADDPESWPTCPLRAPGADIATAAELCPALSCRALGIACEVAVAKVQFTRFAQTPGQVSESPTGGAAPRTRVRRSTARRPPARRWRSARGRRVIWWAGPGHLGAVKRPWRFPIEIHFVWAFVLARRALTRPKRRFARAAQCEAASAGRSSEACCPGRPGRLSALSVFLCRTVFYDVFVWACRALNSHLH